MMKREPDLGQFNFELLKGLNHEDFDLAKLILFTAKENLRIYDFLQLDNGKAVLVDNLKESVNRIIRKLIDNNVLIADYEGSIRISPLYPLYTTNLESIVDSELNVEVIRNCFKHTYLERVHGLSLTGKMSDIKTCERNLMIAAEEYPHLFARANNSILEQATQRYIISCIEQDRFLLDCDNFIWNGKSKLVEFIEIVLDEGNTENQAKSGTAQDWTEE